MYLFPKGQPINVSAKKMFIDKRKPTPENVLSLQESYHILNTLVIWNTYYIIALCWIGNKNTQETLLSLSAILLTHLIEIVGNHWSTLWKWMYHCFIVSQENKNNFSVCITFYDTVTMTNSRKSLYIDCEILWHFCSGLF